MTPADPAGRRGVPAGGWSLGAEPGLLVTASREPRAQARGQRCEEGSTTGGGLHVLTWHSRREKLDLGTAEAARRPSGRAVGVRGRGPGARDAEARQV